MSRNCDRPARRGTRDRRQQQHARRADRRRDRRRADAGGPPQPEPATRHRDVQRQRDRASAPDDGGHRDRRRAHGSAGTRQGNAHLRRRRRRDRAARAGGNRRGIGRSCSRTARTRAAGRARTTWRRPRARRAYASTRSAFARRPSSPGPLRDLAAGGGGSYSEATSPAELRRIYDELGEQLASQYLVRYRSPAGPERRVDVAVKVGGSARHRHRRVHDARPCRPAPRPRTNARSRRRSGAPGALSWRSAC